MKVVLLRHGIAVDRMDPDCPVDRERPLTPKGIERTRLAAQGLAALDVEPDLILTSPLVRAVQTAEIAAQVLDCSDLRRHDALSGGVQVHEVFHLLTTLSAATVVCVGHAPQLDFLLERALGARSEGLAPLKKAGAACVTFEAIGPGLGHLQWFMEPKALRKLGED